jgi:hypothetical protein
MKNHKTRGLLSGAAAVLLVVACGNLTLDDTRLEQVISAGITTQTGVAVTSVNCPNNRPLKTGDTFDCTATTADGATLTITVTQTDDQGNVHWAISGQS